jgi:signal transduction histidine kinase
MHGILLLVLFLASTHLIFRMSRPLEQMHREVKKLREGHPFDARRVESDFAELRTLALTLDETSKELHMREEELRDQTAHALAASRAKSDFLARMSHELRTPLNSIIGFSEILLERRENIPQTKGTAFLENIVRSGKHLLRLINELLDLAKIESGKMELRNDRLDVRDLVWNCTSAMSSIYRKKHQQIEMRLPPDPIFIRGDAGRIEQVLLNLLSNASKFSPERTNVVVSARVLPTVCEIAVTDQGPGINPADHWLVFEEFMQLHGGTQREGTGLGLPLAKRLVEAHGGTLTLDSEEGKGATFLVRIPLEAEVRASAIA